MSAEEKHFLDQMTKSANFFLEYNRGVNPNPKPPAGFPENGIERIKEYIDQSIKEASRDAVLADYGTGKVESGSFKGPSQVKRKADLSEGGKSQNIGAIKTRYDIINKFMHQPIDFKNASIQNRFNRIKQMYEELSPFFQQFLKGRNESATYSYNTLLKVIAEFNGINGVTTKNLKPKMKKLIKEIVIYCRKLKKHAEKNKIDLKKIWIMEG